MSDLPTPLPSGRGARGEGIAATPVLYALTLLLGATSGCELIASADRDRLEEAAKLEGGAGGEGAAVGGAGGVGATECTQASDCPDPMNDCLLRACDSATHACKPAFVGDLTPVAGQIATDCKKVVCDGRGGTKDVDDPTDVPDDGNDCTDDVCFPVGPTNAMSAPGTACDEAGGKTCDGAGTCVECVDDADCPGGACEPLSKTCVPDTCADGVQNGDETDVDCGNGCGSTCVPGEACDDASDCAPPAMQCVGSVCT